MVVLDFSSLSVLAALKLKLVVVLLVVAAVYLLMTKSYKTQCLFGSCRPNYSTYGYYPYVDYTYVGYEVPAGSSRHPSTPVALGQGPAGLGIKDSPHLADLTARVWNSIDIASMAFSALNIQEDDCRRKLVCQADRAAASNPILRAALSWFSPSLARYRTDRSRPEDGAGADLQWLREDPGDPCEEMYPQCRHRDLPPALGGPELSGPAVYHLEEPAAVGSLGTPAQLHQPGGHQHLHLEQALGPALVPAEQSWHRGAHSSAHAQLYRHNKYEYEATHPSYLQPYKPLAEAPPPASTAPTAPARDVASPGQKNAENDDILILDGAAASAAGVAVQAPERQDAADGGAASRSPSSLWVGVVGEQASPGGGASLEPRPPAAAALAPQVWRRMLPAPTGTQTKSHSD
ncbi:uncharacterized protein LOC113204582 [Frankliniella occidentalis]|uniref:Uncharacterized protein LOC113204582 n=1 Tax=Frankliniella occidentalis TaxID=133901 RepID=A0A9C6WVV1_FRAOC|nr:uncharacterized protein LOC113204582 [Frankliniella occidentalis]